MGTSLVSSTSTLVEHGGVVGEWITQLSMQVFCLRVGKHERIIRTTEFRRNAIIPCMFLNLSIADLDPIDRVQPRSRATCVGWLARFNGVATIRAV